MKEVVLLSLALAVVSFTITEAKLFKPFREYLSLKNKFLCELFSCFYCLNHWLAFIAEAIYRPNLFNKITIIDEMATAFVMIYVSTCFSILFIFAFKRLKL